MTAKMRFLLLLLFVLPLQACGQTSAPPATPDRAIAYVNDPDPGAASGLDDTDIFIVDPDSTRDWRLTNNSVPEFSLSWSPDGRRLLYLIDTKGSPSRIDGSQQGDRRIAVMDLQDLSVEYIDLFWARPEGPDIVRDNPWIERLAWSPTDTSTFAAAVRVDRKREDALLRETTYSVILLNQASRSVRTLAKPRHSPLRLYWSCDGTKLAYADYHSREPRVFNTETGERISLPTSDTESGPDSPVGVYGWTPDGTQLLVGDGTSTSTFPVYSVNVSDKSWTQMATLNHEVIDVQSVAPQINTTESSTQLAVLKPVGEDGFHDIWMYDIQRESSRRITNDKGLKGKITPYMAPCGSASR